MEREKRKRRKTKSYKFQIIEGRHTKIIHLPSTTLKTTTKQYALGKNKNKIQTIRYERGRNGIEDVNISRLASTFYVILSANY